MSNNLYFVKGYNEQVNLSHFPDLLILGPQRTGTTWLHRNIKTHPQIFMSTPKEIFYFDKLGQEKPNAHHSEDINWYLNFFYESPKLIVKNNLRTLKRYGEFYIPKIRGEATANYATLRPELIQEITFLNPDIKAILMIRDPVERAWSHAKKNLLRYQNKNLSDLSYEEIKEFLLRSRQLCRGRYTEMINNWSSYLKQGNLFIGFFEELQERPNQFLLKVFNFLGVKAKEKYFSSNLDNKINSTQDLDVPEEFRSLLNEVFQQELEALEIKFGKERYSHWL